MDVTLRIADDLADRYRAHGQPTLEAALIAQLARFAAFSPTDRAVVVGLADRRAIEERVGRHLQSSAELRAAFDKAASLHIGGIEVIFTAGQWQEIAHRASKRGISVQQEVESIVSQMRDLFFNYA